MKFYKKTLLGPVFFGLTLLTSSINITTRNTNVDDNNNTNPKIYYSSSRLNYFNLDVSEELKDKYIDVKENNLQEISIVVKENYINEIKNIAKNFTKFINKENHEEMIISEISGFIFLYLSKDKHLDRIEKEVLKNKKIELAFFEKKEKNKKTNWVSNAAYSNDENSGNLNFSLPQRVVNSYYQRNFDSNNYTKLDRWKDISNSMNKKRIKVGVLEVPGTNMETGDALINTQDKNYFDTNIFYTPIYNRWTPYWNMKLFIPRKPKYGKHSTEVASVIGGLDGVNPYIELYGVMYFEHNGIDGEFGYLFEKDVNVINMSFGYNGDSVTDELLSYNKESLYIDRVARNKPEVLMVFAAGNDGRLDGDKHKLSGQILSKNTIVVGSNDFSGNKSDFSSYNSKNNEREVTLLANGEYYQNKTNSFQGTSYAAPFISGILANSLSKYQEQYNKGKNNIIAISALSTSTYSLNKNNENLTKNGAGIFDYQKLDQAFKSLKYFRAINNNSSKTQDKDIHFNEENKYIISQVKASEGEILRGAIAWESMLKDGKEDTHDFDLELKNSSGITVFSSRKINNNVEFIKYVAKKEDTYTWVLVNYRGKEIIDNGIEIAFTQTKGDR